MKKTRRSVAITLLLALAIVGVFGVAIAGYSGSSNGGSASSEKSAASHAKNASLKTLNVGSDLYPPFVYSDEYGNIVGLDVEILTEAWPALATSQNTSSSTGKRRKSCWRAASSTALWAALV